MLFLSSSMTLIMYLRTQLLISTITWMEVMVGVSEDEQQTVRSFLSPFSQIDIDAKVAEIAVSIRRERKIRLPDAII